MGTESTQPSLLSRVRDPQNRAAWHEFENLYRDLILRYCRRRGLQQSDAEDVRQVVMLNLSRSLPNFHYDRQRGRFRTYLGTVVRNAVSQVLHRPNVAPLALDNSVLSEIADSASDADQDHIWEREWVDHHYRLAMCTLRHSFEARSVQAFDRLLAGDSVEQVAEAFEMSTQAVHKVKQRIKQRLKDLIARQVELEDEPDGTVQD